MRMYEQLYSYLVQYHKLDIPGIGIFRVERTGAVTDFPNRSINPAVYSITLHHPAGTGPASPRFFSWLAEALDISDREAVIRFNDFAFDLKKQLSSGVKISWHRVGVLSTGLAGELRFEPAAKELCPEQPVIAEKIIREYPAHTVRVGEEEKTAAEMIELLAPAGTRKNTGLVVAIVLLVLAFLFAGWYLSANGLKGTAAGNQRKITPLAAPAAS